MFPLARLFLPTIASMAAFILWKCIQIAWYNPRESPLRHLRGPKGTSLILGNLDDIMSDEDGVVIEKWVKEYGDTLRVRGFMNKNQLLTVDTRAVNHILNNNYQKSRDTRHKLAHILGEGLIVVEGVQHRQQRRIMNPAFGPAPVRELTETFIAKAICLRDLWYAEIENDPTTPNPGVRIDVVPWLSKMTLDIIGLTGFNYDFNALDSGGQPNELNEALSVTFSALINVTAFDILQKLVPVLGIIPNPAFGRIRAAQRTMEKIGKELLTNAKAAVLDSTTEKGEIDEDRLRGRRDLLSLLVKANVASGTSDTGTLSDKDVIAQVPTFLVAGHETTSTAVTWALYALSRAPTVQTQLRDELLSVDTDTPSMDDLVVLPYLDAVVRETLRLHPPIPITERVASKDDVLPVEKPYLDARGVVRDTIPIAKDDLILIPILAMNRSRERWGPDAHEFQPARWTDVPEAVSRIPGVWGPLWTFLGGPRACIGYRFSLVELKAIVFTLVRAFEFELAVPASQVCSRMAFVQRPVLRGDPAHQPQLPLLVRAYKRS